VLETKSKKATPSKKEGETTVSFTVIEDGNSLQIRATISDAKELAELIAKLERQAIKFAGTICVNSAGGIEEIPVR
jgi:hypothetical protein